MTGVVTPRRVHVPAGTLPSGQRVRAACSCGWVSSPRVDERRAVAALESEHGYQDARCDVCGRDRDAVDVPWADRYRHLHVITDPMTGDQFLACSDDPETCHTLAAAKHPDPAPATGLATGLATGPATGPAPAAARPQLQVIAGRPGPARVSTVVKPSVKPSVKLSVKPSKYTLLLSQDQALSWDRLLLEIRTGLGRRVDKSELVRVLVALAANDPALRARIVDELDAQLAQPAPEER